MEERDVEEVRKRDGNMSGTEEGVPWSQQQLIMQGRSRSCLRFLPTYLPRYLVFCLPAR